MRKYQLFLIFLVIRLIIIFLRCIKRNVYFSRAAYLKSQTFDYTLPPEIRMGIQ